MTEKIRCGGSYCEVCKKCISPPRLRKHYLEDWWTTCDECEDGVVRITYIPEEGVKTDFHVSYDNIPRVINMLVDAFNKKKNPLAFYPILKEEGEEKQS